MLELRPNCEFCDRDLPADSSAARICTYECTFCGDCVEKILANVCPECGTRIMHGSDDADEIVSIKAGSLDDTSGLQPVAHIWLRSAQSWVQIDRDRYRCFDEEPDNEDELRRLWQAQT